MLSQAQEFFLILKISPPQSTRKKMFFDSSNKPRIVPNSRGKKRHPSTKDLMSVRAGRRAVPAVDQFRRRRRRRLIACGAVVWQAVKCSDPLFVDFLACCLRWDPKQVYTEMGPSH
eukprot:COSAG01_NODE_4858_length_4678_cov_12.236078_7_plen_116_part_00